MGAGMTFRAGHIFPGPNGSGYTLTRDVTPGQPITVDLLQPYGGAPVLVAFELLPRWLTRQLWPQISEAM